MIRAQVIVGTGKPSDMPPIKLMLEQCPRQGEQIVHGNKRYEILKVDWVVGDFSFGMIEEIGLRPNIFVKELAGNAS